MSLLLWSQLVPLASFPLSVSTTPLKLQSLLSSVFMWNNCFFLKRQASGVFREFLLCGGSSGLELESLQHVREFCLCGGSAEIELESLQHVREFLLCGESTGIELESRQCVMEFCLYGGSTGTELESPSY